MSEATGREAIDARTACSSSIRRRQPSSATGQSPIEAGAIVVDEASMIDLEMADALAQAIAPGTRLVLVGDVDQLASVGPGAVLRDVIASRRVACVRLTQIFRQARESLIVVNAHRINDGEPPLVPEPGDERADFYVVERRDPEAAKATIVELVTTRIPRRFGLDPVRDVQVLTPMHRGPCGSARAQRGAPGGPEPDRAATQLDGRQPRVFRVGDKVMQLRNDYDRNVWNGDVGVVASIDPEERHARRPLRRRPRRRRTSAARSTS